MEEALTMYALSTKDNPFNPFDDYDKWFAFDHANGYNSSEYLARLAYTTGYETPKQANEEIEQVIDDIIRLDPRNIYIKVSKTIE